MKKIAVILPVYKKDKPLWVEMSINSILTQSYASLKLFVGVDGPVGEELDQTLARFEKSDAVEVICFKENRGLACVLNDLLDICIKEGVDYIARMDADDISLPERLEKELEYLKKNNLDLVGTYYEMISDAGEHVGVMYGPTSTSEIFNLLPKQNCIGHPTWLFRKKIWEHVGQYDDFRHCQDYHFLLKCRKLNVMLGVLPEVCLKYRLSVGGIGRQKLASYQVTAEYFAENAELIFDVTPDTLKKYLESENGKRQIQEMDTYRKLRDKLRESRWSVLWYGLQLFRIPYGRKMLYNKMKGLCHENIYPYCNQDTSSPNKMEENTGNHGIV